MHTHPRCLHRVGLALVFSGLLVATAVHAEVSVPDQGAVIELAQAGGTEPRDLEPRYQPVQEEPPGWYNSSYIFGMTRTVAGSTMVPAAKVPLFVLTVPLDIVFLPFAAIGGLFG